LVPDHPKVRQQPTASAIAHDCRATFTYYVKKQAALLTTAAILTGSATQSKVGTLDGCISNCYKKSMDFKIQV